MEAQAEDRVCVKISDGIVLDEEERFMDSTCKIPSLKFTSCVSPQRELISD